MMESIILLGTGGHAHSVVDTIEAENRFCIYGFLDIEEKIGEEYRGYKVLGTDMLLEDSFEHGVKNAFVTIGYLGKSSIRNRLFSDLKKIGFILPNIVDKTAIIAQNVILGEGVYIGKGVIVNSGVEIRDMCIINTGAIIEHDSKIGAFSHISVGSVLCGGVQVGSDSFVGANATVIQGKTIGNKCIIGAGTTIRKNVEDNYMVCSRENVKILGGVI